MALNRTNDFLFKWIFGSKDRKDILLSFINSVLAQGGEFDVIKDIELIDRELDPSFYEDKSSRLDILGETMDGVKISIEIQTSDDGDIDQRSLFYWSKIFQDQLKEGMKYRDLRPVIAINVLSFNYFDSKSYHNQFTIMEKNLHFALNDNLQIHFIELKKWTRLSAKAKNRLERWLLFLANNDPLELEEVAMKDTNITKALEAEKKFLSNEQARYIYDLREKSRRDWLSGLANAEERGLEKGIVLGIEKGVEKGKLAIAEKLLLRGASMREVAELTDIPESEILKLVKQ